MSIGVLHSVSLLQHPGEIRSLSACASFQFSFLTVPRQFEDPTTLYPSLNDSYVLGVCTGSLAAAAISCSSSLSDLLPLAVQTVLVAFRLGLRALELRDRLELSVEHRSQPWSTVVSGLTTEVATEAIRTFCVENVRQSTLVSRKSLIILSRFCPRQTSPGLQAHPQRASPSVEALASLPSC